MGFPSRKCFADCRGDFANVKMDELIDKLRLNIQFGPANSTWSNKLHESSHATAHITIRKLLMQCVFSNLTIFQN